MRSLLSQATFGGWEEETNQDERGTLLLILQSPSAGKAALLSKREAKHMSDVRAIYRGYAIYISGAETSWTYSANPLTPELPILSQAVSIEHNSWGRALRKAKRQIDGLLSE